MRKVFERTVCNAAILHSLHTGVGKVFAGRYRPDYLSRCGGFNAMGQCTGDVCAIVFSCGLVVLSSFYIIVLLGGDSDC